MTDLVAHVVGIEDAERGQLVAAAIRLPGRPAPDVDTSAPGAATRLSAYKVPRRIVFLADRRVPMLSSGKLDSRALKEHLGAR